MSKRSPKRPTQNVQREKPLDANTQLWLLSLKKLAPLAPDFVTDGSDLIPSTIMEHFSILLVLSRIGLAAQNAQRVHGVPASLLIGKYLMDYGWDYSQYSRDEAEQLFLEEAEPLRRNLPGDSNLLSSPVEYTIALHKHGDLVSRQTGESDWLYCLDVISRIVEHGFLECDYRYGTGGLYDIGEEVCPEDVAIILGCSAERVARLIESGELPGRYTAYSLSEKRSITWRITGPRLRDYVQRVQVEKFQKSGRTVTSRPAAKTDAAGVHLVPELVEQAAPVADC